MIQKSSVESQDGSDEDGGEEDGWEENDTDENITDKDGFAAAIRAGLRGKPPHTLLAGLWEKLPNKLPAELR
jgi:hypothetical protein